MIFERFFCQTSPKRDQKTQFNIVLHYLFSVSGSKMGTPPPYFHQEFPEIPNISPRLSLSNNMMLASCTQKMSSLPLTQEEKQLVIQCCKHYKVKKFQRNDNFTLLTPTLIYRKPNEPYVSNLVCK
jgi:hypothetical protein